jgi:GABA(A) receptor-associated protein
MFSKDHLSEFKKKNSIDKRIKESNKIRAKYEDRIPIIVEKSSKSKLQDIDKNKFLVPETLTIGQFLYIIRKRVKLNSNDALFIFINNILPCTSSCISNIYNEHKDTDGFLYIQYTEESTFG